MISGSISGSTGMSGGGGGGGNVYTYIIGQILQAVGTGFQMYGMGESMRTEGLMMAVNKDLALRTSATLKKELKTAMALHKEQEKKVLSSQYAHAAASGLTTESFSEVISDTAKNLRMSRALLKYGYEKQRDVAEQQAEIWKWRKKRKRRSDKMQFVGSLFSSSGSQMS